MNLDPLFLAGIAIAAAGVALGLFTIHRIRRWVDKS